MNKCVVKTSINGAKLLLVNIPEVLEHDRYEACFDSIDSFGHLILTPSVRGKTVKPKKSKKNTYFRIGPTHLDQLKMLADYSRVDCKYQHIGKGEIAIFYKEHNLLKVCSSDPQGELIASHAESIERLKSLLEKTTEAAKAANATLRIENGALRASVNVDI